MNPRFFDRLPTLQHLTFWHFHCAGWLLFWSGDVILIFLQKLGPGEVVSQALDAPIGFVLGIGLRQIYHRLNYKRFTFVQLVLLVLFWSVVIACVWHVFMTTTRYLLMGPHVVPVLWSTRFTFRWLSRIVPVWLGWSTLYFGIKYWKDLDAERRRAQDAVSLARRARLQMLRYQVNPHFLFNALNSVRALIGEDRKAAKAMVTELAEFFRYSLVERDEGEVTLQQELDAIRHYLSIEKKRFETNLDIGFEVDDRAGDVPVLSFMLHPLVENAIKHGMKTSPMPLCLRIQACVDESCLRIVVSNTGAWLTTAPALPRFRTEKEEDADGTGTGLENVRARLENAYPGRSRLVLKEEGGWVRASLEIQRPASRE